MSSRGAAPDAPLITHREPIHDWLEDRRAESLSRMLRDARRACDRWAPKNMPKVDRDALAQDAVCVIVEWDSTSGAEEGAYRIRCGRKGCAPSRHVWRHADDWREPSNGAWILLHRAIVQALRAPARLGWRVDRRTDGDGNVIAETREVSTDPADLERMREVAPAAPSLATIGADHGARDNARQGIYPPIPDDVSVRDLADAAGIPLRAARALAYTSVGMAPADAAREWAMTIGAAKAAVSDGAKWIRTHYPDPAQLADVLNGAARQIRLARAECAADALADWTQARTDHGAALRAVEAWRESCRTAPAAIVALEITARRAARRHGADVNGAAENVRAIVRSVDRAKRTARSYRSSNVLRHGSASTADVRRFAAPVRRAPIGAPAHIRACAVCWKVHPAGYPDGIHPRTGAVL